MRKIICVVTGILPCLGLMASRAPEFCDTYFTDGILETSGFYPIRGELGIYLPGETPIVELDLKNLTSRGMDLRFSLRVKDYFDTPSGTLQAAGKIAPKETKAFIFTLPKVTSKGFFTVTCDIFADGKKLVSSQTCFSVIDHCPNPERDPFFTFDKGALEPAFLKAGKRMGIGMLGLYGAWFTEKEDRDPVRNAKKLVNSYSWKKFIASDYKLCVYAVPELRLNRSKKEVSRREKLLYSRDDSDYGYCRKFFETIARELKGRAKFFILQEEFDAHILGQLPRNHIEELANFVLVGKNVYAGIKKGNPESTLAVLGICMSDYYSSNPPFELSRMVLHDLGRSFDYLCFDAYSGNYNGANGPLGPPERDFRKMLMDCADLSVAYNRPYVAFNVERCFGMDYAGALDSQTAKDMANYTARSLIIAKSAPCGMYSIHLVRHWNVAQLKGMKYRKNRRLGDFGLWKHVPDRKGKDARIPRPVVPAIATTANELAFAESPRELIIDRMVYSYSFKGGGKNLHKSVVTLWTTQKEPFPAVLNLPADAVLIDLMGNRKTVKKGKLELLLGQAPFFLVTEASQDAMEQAVKNIAFKRKLMFSGYGRLKNKDSMTVHIRNQSPVEAQCQVVLKGQVIGSARVKAFKDAQIPAKAPSSLNGIFPAELQIRSKAGNESSKLLLDLRRMEIPYFKGEDLGGFGKFELRAPRNIHPTDATMPERGHFFYKGNDPYVDLYMAWHESALRFVVAVHEKELIQKNTLWNIWKGDCVQFGFNLQNDRAGFDRRSRSLTKGGYNFAVAKTPAGVQFFRFYGGKKGQGLLTAKATVTRSGSKTWYRFELPWQELGRSSGNAGDLFGFALVVFNLEDPARTQVPYEFRTSGGVTAGADTGEMTTIVLKGK